MPNLGQVLFTLGNMNNQAYQSRLQQQNLAANQQSLADNALRMQAYQDQQAALGAYGKNFINALTAQTPQGVTAPMPATPPPQPGQASVPMVQPTDTASSKTPPLPTNALAPAQPIAGAMQQWGTLTGAPTVAKGLSQAPSSAGQQAPAQAPQTPDALTGSILNADPTQPIPNPSLQLLSQTLNGPLKPVMDALQKAGQERPQDDPILRASMTAWQKYLSDNPNATPGQLAAFTSVALPQTMDLLKQYSAQTRIPLNSLLAFGGTLAKGVLQANTAQQNNASKERIAQGNDATRLQASQNSLAAAGVRAQNKKSSGDGLFAGGNPAWQAQNEQTYIRIYGKPPTAFTLKSLGSISPEQFTQAITSGLMSPGRQKVLAEQTKVFNNVKTNFDTLERNYQNILLPLVSKVNSGSPIWNKKISLLRAAGDPDAAAWQQALVSIRPEAAQLLSSGGSKLGQVTVHALQEVAKATPDNITPAQLKAAFDVIQGEGKNRLDALQANIGEVNSELTDTAENKKPLSAANPPVAGARLAPDGKWYVQKNGKYYLVQ